MGRWTSQAAGASSGCSLASGVVALAGIGGYLYWQRVETQAEQKRTADTLAAAWPPSRFR